MSKHFFRGAVLDSLRRPLSSVWQVWSIDEEVNVAVMGLVDQFKSSLHSSWKCRHAFVTRQASDQHQPAGLDRAVYKWAADEHLDGSAQLLFQIAIPAAGLGNNAGVPIGDDVTPLLIPQRDEMLVLSLLRMTHWTKHKSRLDREFACERFGDEGYSREELVAELGAAFLCVSLGITPEPREDHSAYIGHWLKVLKEDKRAIFSAAAHAQRAVDYLHALQPKEHAE